MLVLALSRWPGLMPQNFSAVYAMAFCAGLYFPVRLVWVPALTILASDVAMNVLYYHVDAISPWMIPIYLGYGALYYLGRKLNPGIRWVGLVSGGLVGAILFYLITNTASWLQLQYPKTLMGWVQALTTGLPNLPHTWEFFRNTLLSGGLFTGLFVGALKLNEAVEQGEEEEKEAEPVPDPEKAEA